ncbi:FCD domain-containing protein [Streptomyces sp. NPDC002088]|uniref:FCD domain-containing protein n=1 Tax=Streptomyces sp. NPDC002088 TaxID=3154665 RepID=UPI00332BCC39
MCSRPATRHASPARPPTTTSPRRAPLSRTASWLTSGTDRSSHRHHCSYIGTIAKTASRTRRRGTTACWSGPRAAFGEPEVLHDEHERMLQALRDHAPDAARAAVRGHLQRSLEQRIHTLVSGAQPADR